MRICLISATYPPDLCGVGDYTCHLSRALRRAGVQATVLTSQNTSPASPAAQHAGEDVKRLVSRWTLRSWPLLLKEIKTGGYDLVHIQYTPNLYGRPHVAIHLLPWCLSLWSGCRTLVTFHEIYTPMLRGLRNLLLGLYDRVKDTILLLGSHGAILTVPNRVSRLSRLFPWLRGRLYVVPVGAGLQLDQEAPDERMGVRTQLGIRPEEIVVGSFGSLHTDKRYEVLFRVARRLLDRGHPLRLVLIGAYDKIHPYYRHLEKEIAELNLEPYIIWTGFGTPLEVSRWLKMVDIYAMTDLRGASGRKSSLITALAHGLPVVSTRGSDTTEEFSGNGDIVLVDLDDVEHFVHHIERLIRNPHERTELGRRGYQLYESHFSWDTIAQRTITLYHRLLSAP